MKYRLDIQGLRALAVIFVFIFHLNHDFLPGGFIGVDIFFVVSGFLISSITLHQLEQHKFRFLDFYIKRGKRIIPAYLFMLTIITLVGAFIFLPNDIGKFKSSVFQTFIFNSNNYFATLDDYFGATSTEFPLLHTWSLAIEMQFYVLLPIILYVVRKRYLNIVLISLIVILTGYSYINSTFLNNHQAMYFSLLARMPEFLIGSLFALNVNSKLFQNNAFSNSLSPLGLVLVLLSGVFINEASNFPGVLALIPCIGTGLLLIAPNKTLQDFLSNKVLVFIGELSYSIYLWHWPIMALIRYYKAEYHFTVTEMIGVCALTFAISFLSYKFIEVPLRTVKTKAFSVKLAVLVLSLILVFLGINRINSKIFAIPKQFTDSTFGLDSHANTFKKIEVFGTVSKKSDSILLIGDSHALVYKPFLDYIGGRQNFNFSTVTNNSFPVIPYLSREDFPNDSRYSEYNNLVKNMLKELPKAKYIIFSSLYADKVPSIPNALENFIKQNLNKNQKLLILENFPTLSRNPVRVDRSFIKQGDNTIKIIEKPIPDKVAGIIRKYPNVYLIKLDFKNISADFPYKNDTVMYYDEDHLNIFGAIESAKKNESYFMKQLRELK